MKLRELIRRLSLQQKDEFPVPEDLDAYLEDFLPNVLLKSETLQKAFGISGHEMEELYNEGFMYYEANRFADALTVFRWLVLLNPFQKKYWMGLAANQQILEQYLKALHSYAVAALLDSEDPYPHYYAYLCYTAHNEENTEEDTEKALEMAYQRCSGKAAYQGLKNEIEEVRHERSTSRHAC